MKYPLGMALTITALFFAPFIAPSDCQAAQTKSKTKKASNWPQWYYLDQLGLQQWNQRKKEDAKRTLTKAFRQADLTLGGRKNLDPVTKRRLKGLLEHQLFLMSYFMKMIMFNKC